MDLSNDQLLQKIEQLKSEKEQAEGAKAEILRQLKKEFGVDSLEAARILRDKYKEKYEKIKIRANQERQKLEKEIAKHERLEEEDA